MTETVTQTTQKYGYIMVQEFPKSELSTGIMYLIGSKPYGKVWFDFDAAKAQFDILIADWQIDYDKKEIGNSLRPRLLKIEFLEDEACLVHSNQDMEKNALYLEEREIMQKERAERESEIEAQVELLKKEIFALQEAALAKMAQKAKEDTVNNASKKVSKKKNVVVTENVVVDDGIQIQVTEVKEPVKVKKTYKKKEQSVVENPPLTKVEPKKKANSKSSVDTVSTKES